MTPARRDLILGAVRSTVEQSLRGQDIRIAPPALEAVTGNVAAVLLAVLDLLEDGASLDEVLADLQEASGG